MLIVIGDIWHMSPFSPWETPQYCRKILLQYLTYCLPPTPSTVLNVPGIEKKVEKCSIEATQSTVTSTFCKESCSKFLSEGIRKRNSLFVLYGSFDEHYTEIIHLRLWSPRLVTIATNKSVVSHLRNPLYDSYGRVKFFNKLTPPRQELASVVSCAMMFDLESCNEQQAEALLWKDVFYQLIQHYRNAAGKASVGA